jgi:hypothetical protein
MIATALGASLVLALAVAAFILMRSNGRKTSTAYDRRTGRRLIEHLVHDLIEEHDDEDPLSGKILDEAWAAANDAESIYALGPAAVSQGAEAALVVYEDVLRRAIDAPALNQPVPTLADLLDAVRDTPLDTPLTTMSKETR